MVKKLDASELNNTWDIDNLSFQTTDEIKPFQGIIGQERAERALEFGLHIRNKPYHIFVSGDPGTGRTSFSKEFAQHLAKKMQAPKDLVYVYNFQEPKRPTLLSFPAGIGKAFMKDMEDFVARIEVEFSKSIILESFEEERMALNRIMKEKNDQLVDSISAEAAKRGFGMKSSSSGIYFMPMIDGEMLSEEAYDALPPETKNDVSKESDAIQVEAISIMNDIRKNEDNFEEGVNRLSFRIALQIIGRLISPLFYKYKETSKVVLYLKDLKEDFLGHVESYFLEDAKEDMSPLFPFLQKKQEAFLEKYRVNLLTTTNPAVAKGAPVIVEYNPSFASLIGEIEYDSDFGSLTTDYMKIKPGVFHRANGGFLILQAIDVLQSSIIWDALKKVIKTNEVAIEPLRELLSGIAMEGVKPEKTPLDVKIILIGSYDIYAQLERYDDDFSKLFKIHAMFDEEMDFTKNHVEKIAGFIKKFQDEHHLLPFTKEAVASVINFSIRLAESQDKLSAYFGKLSDLLVEGSAWAEIEEAPIVSAKYIQKALDEDAFRKNLYAEKIKKSVLDQVIQITTEGEKIGQINGLAVLSSGDYVFGNVLKVTATTFMGKSGIISIEKEADLSGEIHDKGVQVISGFLGQRFAQHFPLSLTCHVGFEQSYGGIDGDSASSTELYSILSSLAEIPIRQDLAVTGSVNQWGDIQAIGGATYKIEAFFEICQARGFTGKEGVIIPKSNIKDLVLKDSVVEAVKAEKFSIYAIETIEEGLEILTGVKAGRADEDGIYPPHTIFGEVYEKLKNFEMYDNQSDMEKEAE